MRVILKNVAVILVSAGALAAMILIYKQHTSSTGIYRMEYEGRVLEKSETLGESDTGSYVRRRLLIEGKDGRRFEVAVSRELYARVQKGMWIKRSSKGVELSWP